MTTDPQVDTVTQLLVDAIVLAEADPGVSWWVAIAQAAPLSWVSWCAAFLAKEQAVQGRDAPAVLQAAIDDLQQRVREVTT